MLLIKCWYNWIYYSFIAIWHPRHSVAFISLSGNDFVNGFTVSNLIWQILMLSSDHLLNIVFRSLMLLPKQLHRQPMKEFRLNLAKLFLFLIFTSRWWLAWLHVFSQGFQYCSFFSHSATLNSSFVLLVGSMFLLITILISRQFC